ncbi:MAG: ATP-binding protein [Anaerolineales bacterium]|jgi:PAS domain S-box-containing protein|nr:ATP-binding protein [Anaerolineales bacterium]
MLSDFRVRQRDYLLEITKAITQELDLDKVLTRILRVSAEMLAGQVGLIVLRGEEGGWTAAASHGIPPAFLNYLDPLLADIPDHNDPAQFELPKINSLLQQVTRVASLGLLGGVGLPMISRGQVVGMIFIFRNYAGRFSSNDRALLQSFADQAAIAVRNAQLYSQIIQEKHRMDALLDTVPDGILIMNSEFIIERCNIAVARMLGVSAEEIIGPKHEKIIMWERLEHEPALEEAAVGGWPLTPNATLYVEGDLKRSDMQPLPVGITYAPLFSSDGTLLNVIATVRDITHFREAEELKSTFVSVISHELKTPVALIKGYVGTLRREDATWDREIVQDSLAVIEDEADRLTELIENLLDATRLQAGTLSLSRSDVLIPVLAERMATRFQVQTDRHTIVLDFPDDCPVILGDENRLEQVFANLLSNAIKYSPQGGEIRITGQVHSDYVVVCVSDQGPGIAPEDIPHVFDRFYRAPEASRNTKGAGLGLFLTRAVVESHGGRIWIDPKPGDGARICFSLPRLEANNYYY